MTALRHRPFALAGFAFAPTALSHYLISTASKDYSSADNLSRFGLLVLQPLVLLLSQWLYIPSWTLQSLVYMQFPVYALLLCFPKTEAKAELFKRSILWWHVSIVTLCSLSRVVRDA